MSGRRIIALVGLTIALVLALAAGAPNFDGEREADAGALTPADVCADPDDCRLWEAGQIAGVRVGFAVGRVNQAQG